MTRSRQPEPGSSGATEQLHTKGFVVADLLSHGEVARAAAWSGSVATPPDHLFVASHAHLAPSVRREVDREVGRLLGPALRRTLPGWRVVASALLWKPAGNGAQVPYHQDLTFTDERAARSYVAWVPLIDVVECGGRLTVVPGSHRWTDGIRPGGGRPLPTHPLQERLEAVSHPVRARAGQAVVFDVALLHGSEANTSALDRPVLAASLVPDTVPLTYFHRGRAGPTHGFRIDEEFFFGEAPFNDEPTDYDHVTPWSPDVTTADIQCALDGRAA